jgi:hypothetical protein
MFHPKTETESILREFVWIMSRIVIVMSNSCVDSAIMYFRSTQRDAEIKKDISMPMLQITSKTATVIEVLCFYVVKNQM